MGTAIVIAVVLAIVGLAIRSIVKGRSCSCGSKCSCCPMAGQCHSEKKKDTV